MSTANTTFNIGDEVYVITNLNDRQIAKTRVVAIHERRDETGVTDELYECERVYMINNPIFSSPELFKSAADAERTFPVLKSTVIDWTDKKEPILR
jgi:hypothetical protein